MICTTQDGETLLMRAAEKGDTGIVEWLLNHGADPKLLRKVSCITEMVDVLYLSTDILSIFMYPSSLLCRCFYLDVFRMAALLSLLRMRKNTLK